ncbi:MAG: glutathione S-transferase N-terminal domain-containing protein, partial [Aestuariivirgaceae bacterium]|nr:glutathione S-transferase N-terminal domain-containing protein [Aestuariivirgaceae bacterium]
MYTLYGRPATGSAAVEALLEELGLPYRLENVSKGPDGQPSPAFLATINPLGQVPALKLPDGTVITESAAIMIYLADLVPGANLAPLPTHPARAHY